MELKGAILRNFYNVGTLVSQPNPEEYFSLKIPHYQRPYKWDEERVSLLILDWQENRNATKDSNKEYFAGAVVTVAESNSSTHSLIDGQQRITTLFLANFINFILLRNLILSEIERKRCGKIESYSDALKKSALFVFRDKNIISHFEKLTERLKQLSDDDEMDALHNQNMNYMKEFHDGLWIPQYILEDYPTIDLYQKAVVDELYNNLNDDALNLHYDRSSFNSSLIKVLSQLYLTFTGNTGQLEYKIFNADQLSENEAIYSKALETILETFEKIVPKQGLFHTYVHNLHHKLTEFIDEVKVCVIQTGATEDAYTLFEVMNDRALELDDLDLIKNQFFKKFVLSNKNLTEEDIDHKIQLLDKQWGDNIFHHPKIGANYKKLVTYLGTVFITGDVVITNTKNEKYRKTLDTYLTEQISYTFEDIQRDFNIFQICFELLQKISLPLQRREHESLLAEYQISSSEFKKTLYFLNAQKQDGVISGLVNYFLSAIGSFNPNFNIPSAKKMISLVLQENCNAEIVKNIFSDITDSRQLQHIEKIAKKINEQSKALWITSMMSPNASIPRDLSKRIIKESYLESTSSYALEVQLPPYDTADLSNEFLTWLNDWSHAKDTSFKIKALFAKLLRFDLVDQHLIISPIQFTIDTKQIKELELDHLVAKKVQDSSIFAFEHDDRDFFINGLGNMMPLPPKENVQKSDYPLEKSFKFYEKSGLDKHFLLDELKTLVDDVQENKLSQIDFFSKRKELLTKYFSQIVKS